MRSIGFDNFRRFEKLDGIKFSPITIFVGGNNSGKSTVVKGILSLMSFLDKSCDLDTLDEETDNAPGSELAEFDQEIWVSHNQRFRFNTNYFAHIGTYSRAMKNGGKSSNITFRYGHGSWDLEICITMDDKSEEATSGRVKTIRASNKTYNTVFSFNLIDWKAEVTICHDDPEKYRKRLEDESLSIGAKKTITELYELYSKFSEDMVISVPLPEKIYTPYNRNLIKILVSTATTVIKYGLEEEGSEYYNAMLEDLRRDYSPISKPEFTEEQRTVLSAAPMFLSHVRRFVAAFSGENIEYVYAHAVTQSVVYSAKDTNDYLVKTVHEFASRRISSDSKGEKKKLYRFITKWMKEFEIGTDYQVDSVGGEAHIVKIKNNSGNWVNLADMGMGSIQLIILLFRIATVLKRTQIIMILEEPEQNIHPRLQSKLADLILEIWNEHHVQFIIETHSEYLIRETQVIVGRNNKTKDVLTDNPFKVYYFPSGGQPYDMVYTPTGDFENSFDEGFFDEAARLYMTVLQNSSK